jgi:hypothetical protein
MMQGGPPSICANIAVVNDETASATFRCGYLRMMCRAHQPDASIEEDFARSKNLSAIILTTRHDVHTLITTLR